MQYALLLHQSRCDARVRIDCTRLDSCSASLDCYRLMRRCDGGPGAGSCGHTFRQRRGVRFLARIWCLPCCRMASTGYPSHRYGSPLVPSRHLLDQRAPRSDVPGWLRSAISPPVTAMLSCSAVTRFQLIESPSVEIRRILDRQCTAKIHASVKAISHRLSTPQSCWVYRYRLVSLLDLHG